jgi:hypothetical protein
VSYQLIPRIKPGDRITLNEKAREWTHGKIFTVSETKVWGVVCHTQQLEFYSADWDEIERKLYHAEWIKRKP